jgi:hypothetical protein
MIDSSALDRLLAKDAIRDLVQRYSRCIDSRLLADFGELFTTAGHLDYGPMMGGPIDGRAVIVDRFTKDGDGSARERLGIVATSHHNANVLIDVLDDERARATTSLYAWHLRDDGERMELWGHYEDEFVVESGAWRFPSRVMRVAGSARLRREVGSGPTGHRYGHSAKGDLRTATVRATHEEEP